MSNIALEGNTSGTGTLTIAAPNTNTDRTLTLPDSAGEILLSDGDGSNLTGLDKPPILHHALVTSPSSTSPTSNAWMDITGMSVTFTPQSSSSTFRIDARWAGETDDMWNLVFGINRNGTVINLPTGAGSRNAGLSSGSTSYPIGNNDSTPEVAHIFTYDEPATSSSLTYKLQFKKEQTGVVYHGQVMGSNNEAGFERFSLELLVTEYP